MPRWTVLLLVILGQSAAHPAMADECLDFGPAVDGLRLGLRIVTTRETGEDFHAVTLSISNETTGTVTLEGRWFEKTEGGTYGDWMRRRSVFECEPKWPILTAQTMWSGEFEGRQPQVSIPPRGEFSASWSAEGIHLKPRDCYNSYPGLRDDGLYMVRANFTATRADGRSTKLVSNDVPVSIGGSLGLPKRGLCRVKSFDPEAGVVILDSGALEGIAVGDEFSVHPRGLTLRVPVQVESVDDMTARCKMLTTELPTVCEMDVNWDPKNLEAMCRTPLEVLRHQARGQEP